MGTVLAPEFVAIYVRVAADYRLPLVICPALAAYGGPHNLRGVTETTFAPGVALARAAGFRIFDRIAETAWDSALPARGCRPGNDREPRARPELPRAPCYAPGRDRGDRPQRFTPSGRASMRCSAPAHSASGCRRRAWNSSACAHCETSSVSWKGKGQDGPHRRRPDRHGVHGQVPCDGLWGRPGRLWRRPRDRPRDALRCGARPCRRFGRGLRLRALHHGLARSAVGPVDRPHLRHLAERPAPRDGGGGARGG